MNFSKKKKKECLNGLRNKTKLYAANRRCILALKKQMESEGM